MKRLSFLLALSLAAPGGAVVTGRVGPTTPLPTLPVSVIASGAAAPALTPAPFIAPSLTAPAPFAAADAFAPQPAASLPESSDAKALHSARLEDIFAALDGEFPLPSGSPTAVVRERIRAQLRAALRDFAEPEPELLATVARESDKALARIQRRLDAGEVDPMRSIRLSESDAEVADGGHARVGVYPVAADPFQWGHLLIALRAVGELGVDKIVFVLAGDDPRKPTMTPVDRRHPIGQEVLDIFAPFFAYSPIAVGTTLDGETNIFRILALNPDRRVDAWYMVGDDHYRLVDKKGNPDTLPKLERNFREPMGHSPTLHALKVAFIKREAPADEVPTSLEVRFLDHVGFDASSTQVRGGRHALMPHAAFDAARRHGLYGIEPAAP